MKNQVMPKAVIFDMDGVLVDTMETHYLAWVEAFAAIGIAIRREDFAATPGKTAAPVIRALGRRDFSGEEIRDLAGRQRAAVLRILRRSFPAMPGADALIRRLGEAGWLMAVGTSGPQEQIDVVRERLAEGRRLKVGVSASDVRRGKPDPEVFLKAAGRLGVAPGRSVVVEDSVAGLEAARAGGFRSVGLTSTFPAGELLPLADLVVDSLRAVAPGELDRLIDRKSPTRR